MRFKARRLRQLRRTFDEISAQRKKNVAINPESLPQSAKERIIESSLEKGEQNTPFGHITSPAVAAKAIAKTAVSAWSKWDAVGALAAGSFIDLAPRLKRS